MVRGPYSRGCGACRQAKKKCDEVKPTCSRCARLMLTCQGVGQPRYRFVISDPGSVQSKSNRARALQAAGRTHITPMPSSSSALVVKAFVYRLDVTDVRYDLATCGAFLRMLPQRLGSNKALEAAVDAFGAAASEFHLKEKSTGLLKKYGHALKTLRLGMENPSDAEVVELCCAIYLIMIMQSWLNNTVDPSTPHEAGLAYLVDILCRRDGLDSFQIQFIAEMCKPVLFASLTANNLDLSPAAWAFLNKLGHTQYTETGPPTEATSYSRPGQDEGPNTLRLEHVRELRQCLNEPETHYRETRYYYYTSQCDLAEFTERLNQILGNPLISESSRARLHRDYVAAITFLLCAIISLNLSMQAFHPEDDLLLGEFSYFIDRLIEMARRGLAFRPFGTWFMPTYLGFGIGAVQDEGVKETMTELLEQYLSVSGCGYRVATAEWWYYKFMKIRLRIGSPRPGDDAEEAERQVARTISFVQCNTAHNYIEATFF
ncbi:hypothetical protein B0I35DRAFT_352124 [Stachybotrys elegans]|uniref:Zn(2)-C6 fungal-type domain-containing protein n=1 Tax=Stachybotrys elegans TaxID=80388 RepID=A0A8K0SS31_9HYPO|nr:hypothetical protein B0I35DRAFT_352124 [Stachybotrys elegans]